MTNDNSVGSVTVGTWVKVVEHGSGDEEVFYIVENRDTDYLKNKIPPDNPMGRALLGSKPGDEVAVDGPHGAVKFSIVDVGQP